MNLAGQNLTNANFYGHADQRQLQPGQPDECELRISATLTNANFNQAEPHGCELSYAR